MNIDIGLWEKQIKFLSASERDVLLQCGIGYGKSFVGSVFVPTMVLKHPKKRGMIVARDYKQFKRAILPELEKVFQIFGWRENVDYIYNKADMFFKFNNGTIVDIASAENYNSSFRGPNVAWIWCDECDYYKPEAWTTMLGRLRVKPELLRATSSPKGFNHIYEHFFVNDNENKLVLEAPSWENLNLSAEYISSLKSAYSPRLYEQEVCGKRLNINVGAVYSEFKREIHVKPCRDLLTEKDQLYFFTDYNISNYCGIYQFYNKETDTVYSIGEEHLKFEGSRVMARTVKSRWPNRPVIVVGDSTGNNKRDVAIDKTNYEHFRDAGLLTQKFKNPPVQARIISANSHLFHRNHIVDPSCTTLIKDLELLAWREDGKDIDKSNLDLSHASDAWSYGDYYFHGIGKPKRKVGFTTQYY